MSVVILAIESSCDDTSASVLCDGRVLSNCIATQLMHVQYGGVVPEVASRAHMANIVPVVDAAIQQAGIQPSDITAVAFTRGPGLIGSLLVGVSFAKAMALSLGIPMVEVHHIQGHVMAHFIEEPFPVFPFICLTVAGGHTQIAIVRHYDDMEIIGTTIDDAAGEAFDKTGKLLGLDYPAGPIIDKLAQQGKAIYKFPEPEVGDLSFSFSGLKTSILRFLELQTKDNPTFIRDHMNDICASVQERIVSILLRKVEIAAKRHQITDIAIAGGVSANSGLRNGLVAMCEKNNWRSFIPRFEYCTDNAAMIAIAGYHKYLKGEFVGHDVTPLARFTY